jgi:uncharacterized membrane protein
MLECN